MEPSALPPSSPAMPPQPTRPKPRWTWLAVLLTGATLFTLLGLLAGAWWAIQAMPHLASEHTVHTHVQTPEVPVVLRTPGGVLEVATIRATERFSRRDSKSIWGLDLGETVTEVSVQASYRFHIPLAQRWPIHIEHGMARVDAPAPRPSLPVAFDTASLQVWGRNGWARFNKDDSLLALQRSMSAQLAERAQAPHYQDLAREAARRTVAEYVRTWLATSGHPVLGVHVRFPGEAQSLAPATPASQASP